MSIKGESGIIYIRISGTWKPLACLTSTGLSSQLSMIESTTKCFPGVVKKTPGQLNNSISAEGEFIDTTTVGGDSAKVSHDRLFLIQQTKTLTEFKYDTNITDSDSTKYFGFAYFTDLELTQGSGDEVSTFSVTLDVDGAISLTDPYALVPIVYGSSHIVGDEGESLEYTITASNTPTSYSASGLDLFPGLSLNTTTGVISGSIAESVEGQFYVYATNSVGTSAPFTIHVIIQAV